MSVERVVEQVEAWLRELGEWGLRVAGVFARPEPRVLLEEMTRGLISPLAKKNSWTLSEAMGHSHPGRLQTFLCRGAWDANDLVSIVRELVDEQFGGPDAVLIVDDTQIIKKGVKSVGVAPQHCGSTNQVENCQVLVMAALAGERGHAFIGHRLYLPARWTDDPVRMRQAGVPEGVVFATKPEQAVQLFQECFESGTRFGWIAVDGGYGQYRKVRDWPTLQSIKYVMAVPRTLRLAPVPQIGGQAGVAQACDLLGRVTRWERRSCGHGSKGERYYDWALRTVTLADGEAPAGGFEHTLLIRRTTTPTGDDSKDVDYFLVHAPVGTPAREMIRVAGTRWRIEECNEQSKDLLGLDQHQVRTWTALHHQVAVCVYAHAFTATRRARLTDGADREPAGCAGDDPDSA